MKIQTIQVSAGRTFNHPHESYSNLRPSVTLIATVDDGEDAVAAAKALQAQAEQLVEDHKQGLLKSLEDLFDLTERQREMVQLKSQLETAQARLDQIRQAHPQLTQGTLAESPHQKDDTQKHHCPQCGSSKVGPSGGKGELCCVNCGFSGYKDDFPIATAES